MGLGVKAGISAKMSAKIRTRVKLSLFLLITVFFAKAFGLNNACQLVFTQSGYNVPFRGYHEPRPRSLEEIRRLRVLTYNLREFHYTENASQITTKPFEQLVLLGQNLRHLKPDIMILEEANPIAVKRFQDRFLNNEYTLYTTQRNLENMGIVFAVKSDLPFQFQLEQHRGLKWTDPLNGEVKPLFPRDVPGLLIGIKGERTPRLILVGHHGKSKKNREDFRTHNIDYESQMMRVAQIEGLSRIVQHYKHYFPSASVVLAGDFNTEFSDKAMRPLREQVQDAFDVSREKTQIQNQVTHVYFYKNQRHLHKIDMILGMRAFSRSVLKSFVYFMRDAQGRVQGPPTSYSERESRMSDHMPLVVDFDFRILFGWQPSQI